MALGVTLRGHHLLCALGFRGLGYSPAFAANMAAVLAALDAAPARAVTVSAQPDAICAAFPPDQPTHCEEADVRHRDRRVLTAIGLQPGARLAWRDIRRRLATAFAPEDLQDLCATCPWLPLGHCAAGLDALRRGMTP